jgi:putative flippase GtrA
MTINFQSVTTRDIVFAAINGGIFGILTPFIAQNIAPNLVLPSLFWMTLGFALFAVFGLLLGALLAHWFRPLFQLSKFVIIGIANTAIDFGVMNILIIVNGLEPNNDPQYMMYKSISFAVAVVNSYFWNKFWTFKKRKSIKESLEDKAKSSAEFFQFIAISISGAAISIVIANISKNIFADETGLNVAANIGAAFATIFVMAWNFLGYKYIAFKK